MQLNKRIQTTTTFVMNITDEIILSKLLHDKIHTLQNAYQLRIRKLYMNIHSYTQKDMYRRKRMRVPQILYVMKYA